MRSGSRREMDARASQSHRGGPYAAYEPNYADMAAAASNPPLAKWSQDPSWLASPTEMSAVAPLLPLQHAAIWRELDPTSPSPWPQSPPCVFQAHAVSPPERVELLVPDGRHRTSTTASPYGLADADHPPVVVPSAKRKKKATNELHTCLEPNCGKQFPRSFALRRHMRIHTGTKPYVCDYVGCTQRFNTSGNLSRHKRIHSGERPYSCIVSTCGKKFNTSTKLKRHMRVHFPDALDVFRCVSLGCLWTCENYKEFAAHQKTQHNVVVGAGFESPPPTHELTHTAAILVPGPQGLQADSPGDRYQVAIAPDSSFAPPSRGQHMSVHSKSSANGFLSPPLVNSYKLDGVPKRTSLERQTNEDTDSAVHYPKTTQLDASHRGHPSSGFNFPSSLLPSTNMAPCNGTRSFFYDASPTLAISSGNPLLTSTVTPCGASSLVAHPPLTEVVGCKNEDGSQHHAHQPHPHASPAHHHILRPPARTHLSQLHKIGGPLNPGADFTGDDLSAVFELIRDPCY